MISKINNEIKQAMIDKNIVARDVLKSVKNTAVLMAKAAKTDIDNGIVTKAVKKEMKQLKETLSAIPTESELYRVTAQQIEVIKKYMPVELSDEELKKRVKEILSKIPSDSPFGIKMKTCMSELKDIVDGKRVKQAVQEYESAE